MVKKTNVLLVALMATMSVEAARSATYAEKVYVDSRDTTLINRMKTQDSRLAMIRDWVNPQDEAGNRAVLETQAQDAYRAINELKSTLEAAIAEKQEKGDYLVADDLKDLQNAVSALDSGKADVSTVSALQETIGKLGETYATKAGMTDADNALKASIDALDTALKAINLSEYAKSADVNVALTAKEDVTNKLATATADEIDEMTTDDKQKKFPSVAVAQTIANAAVSKVNEFAGDLTELENQVSTNTADIKQINEAGYQTKSDVDTALQAKQDVLTADNIVSGSNNVSVGFANGVYTISATDSDTTYGTATADVAGLVKLYADQGTSTEGTMTQAAITNALNGKLATDATAVRATADAAGNNIAETYATKDAVADKLSALKIQGSYLVNFDANGVVSYVPIEILDGQGQPITLTASAVEPGTSVAD